MSRPRSGYNIGMRLVDEYFAKTGAVRCPARQSALRWLCHPDVLRRFGSLLLRVQGRCADFRDAADAVAKARPPAPSRPRGPASDRARPASAQVALKMFLGVTANVSAWNAEGTACSLARAPVDYQPCVRLG